MFSNPLKMNKIDGNASELWQIGCEKYNFNIGAFVGFLCELFINAYLLTYLLHGAESFLRS